MTDNGNVALAELRDGPLYRFADWPNPAVPNGRIGVYTIWHGDQLIYVGMAGRALVPSSDTSEPVSAKLSGLPSRLASHASGRRSGDQFCVYVFDRLVLPTLSRQQIQEAARGQLSLDDLTRQLIRQSFGYRFTLLSDAAMARAVERDIQRDGLVGQPPLLNPLRRTSRSAPLELRNRGEPFSHRRTLLTDLLTTAVDDPGYSWITHRPATSVSRLIR